jgi:hypothetical protein
VCWPFLRLCRLFCGFERFLDSKPERVQYLFLAPLPILEWYKIKVASRAVCTFANCDLNYQLVNKVALANLGCDGATGGFR